MVSVVVLDTHSFLPSMYLGRNFFVKKKNEENPTGADIWKNGREKTYF